MCPQPGRQKSNTLCSPFVMNSKILFSKWRSHYQNLYLEHGKASHLDTRFLHYGLSLLPSSTTVCQMAEVQACFPPNCGVRHCHRHFLVHKRENPNKQSTVRNFWSLDGIDVNIAAWGIWEMHNNLCQKNWEKCALTLTF